MSGSYFRPDQRKGITLTLHLAPQAAAAAAAPTHLPPVPVVRKVLKSGTQRHPCAVSRGLAQPCRLSGKEEQEWPLHLPADMCDTERLNGHPGSVHGGTLEATVTARLKGALHT